MDQSVGEYNLLAMVDDVEGIIFYAKEKNFSVGILNGLESIHDTIVELEPLVQTAAHQKRIKADLEKIIQELKETCKKGEEMAALGKLRTLRDRANALKVILERMK